MKKNAIKKMMYIASIATTTIAFAACSTAKTTDKGNQATGNVIKIGENMELSGAAGGYGQQQKQGIQIAVSEINKAGGIKVDGKKKKIKLIVKDNKTSTSTSASVAAQLVNNDKVAAIVGPATTNAGTAQIPNITKAGVASVSPSATDPDYTQTKNGKTQKYVFRACYENNFQGKTAAKFVANNLKAKKVAVFADNSSDYGTGLAKAFKNAFSGKVVDTQYFSEGDKDFNAVLTSIKAKNVDAIYVPGYYTEVGTIIKQAREAGIKAAIVGSDGMADPKLAKIAGNSNASKVYYTTPFSAKAAATSSTAKKFMKEYKAKYNAEAPTFSALAYDSVYMIKAAIEKENSADSEKIAEGLAKLKDVKGVAGDITINSKHNPEKPITVEQLTNGKVSKTTEIK